MDLEKVWTDLMRQLKSYPNVNASQIDAFFSRVQIQAVSMGFIMLTSDNVFIKDWIEKHYLKDLQQALRDLYGVDFMVQVEVDPSFVPSPAPQAAPAAASAPQAPAPTAPEAAFRPPVTAAPNPAPAAAAPVAPAPAATERRRTPEETTAEAVPNRPHQDPSGANSLMTFDTFVIGESNRMARSMAIEVADRPGMTDLNPLFIYGRSGVGKTHLLRAIQNYVNEQYTDFNVCYIESMELVNRYSDAAIEKSVDKQSFRNFESYFQEADVLLVDEIQGLQDKPGTLTALFRIFNNMIDKGKQVVFAADRAPANIDLDERYVSRFNSGATIDIQPPDDETKRNIIKSFIKTYQNDEGVELSVPDKVLDYIVDNSSSNVRELKSAITKAIFALKMEGEDGLSERRLEELLGNHFQGGGKKRITIEMVQGAVEDFYGVAHKEIVGKKRERRIVHPRQVAIYLCRELSESPLKTIGNAFNRDHTTVMHSCDLITNQMQEDRNLREELESIREKIRIQQY